MKTRSPAVKPPRKQPGKPVPPPLELKDREALIKILNDPVFVRAMERAQTMKPSPFCAGQGSDVKDAAASTLAACNRLHEIRGWELFEVALYAQTLDRKPARAPISETFPDSGLIDHENKS